MFSLPDDLVRTNTQLHGEAGVQWLNAIPTILRECQRRWSLTVGLPFPGLCFNYVLPATAANGASVVLKICFPDREFHSEAEALIVFDGTGAVRLLNVDRDSGALLLERIQPGTQLSSASDERATSIAAAVMRKLWRPPPENHSFPSVADWGAELAQLRAHFGGSCGPFPERLVQSAEKLFAELVASMTAPVILHGDLHHGNILADQRQGWIAIDPKGVVGEPEYEIGALLRNPLPDLLSWPQPGRTLARRLDQLADELAFDRHRLHRWAQAQAVLSAWWAYHQGEEWMDVIAVAELLASLK